MTLHAALAAAVLVVVTVAGCAHEDGSQPTTAPQEPARLYGTRFVALGDAGTGEADQFKVAHAIERVCAEHGCDFAVELGDNIYDAGAASADDPQFDAKFEVPYANLTFPFWLVLGNHDNSEDPAASGATAGTGLWYQAGDNEVAYGQRTDRASDKWHMPNRYYTFTAGPVGFVAIDTNTLLFDDVPFPPEQLDKVQAQSRWIDGALSNFAANVTWRIALGHHGYLSNGPHGNAGAYDGRGGVPGQSGDYAKQFFEDHVCDKVDVYLFGHDHDLQWLDEVPPCGKTNFIGSGGGGAATYDLVGANHAVFAAKTLGFWWLEIVGDRLHAVAYDGGGAVLFEGNLQRT